MLRLGISTLAILLTATASFAQVNGTWNLFGGGNYETAANWTNTGVPGTGGVATFGGSVTAAATVTLSSTPTLGGIVFSNTNSNAGYVLSSTAGTYNFNTGATITFGSTASNTMSAPAILSGTLTLNGLTWNAQLLSGAFTGGSLIVNTAVAHLNSGRVALSGSNSFSGVTLQSGILRVENAGALGAGTLTAAGGILQGIGITLPNAIDVNTANLVTTSTGGTMTLAGNITGTNGLVAMPQSSGLTLTGASSFTGTATIQLQTVDTVNALGNAGTLTFNSTGTALNASGFTASGGGRLFFDNTALVNGIARHSGTATVNLLNGSYHVVAGSDATPGVFMTQNAGALNITGHGVVATASQATTTEGVAITFASLNRGTTGTVLFNGSDATFGTAPAGTGLQNIKFTAAPATVGGVVPTATPIIPFAIGGITPGSAGTGLVTYDVNGIRLLNEATEYSIDPLAFTADDNILLTSAAPTPTNATAVTINSLHVNGAASLTGAGVITITSGTLLFRNSPIISTPLAFGTVQAKFFTAGGNVVVSGPITGTGGLVKAGGSTLSGNSTSALTLAAYNTYTGTTAVNDGYIQFTDPSALGLSNTSIELNSRGATSGAGLRLDTGFASAGLAVRLERPIITNNGYSNLTSSFSGGNTPRQVFIAAGNINGSGGLMISGTSDALARGMTILAGTNSYTGSTRLFAGDIGFASDANLGAASASVDFGTSIAVGPPITLSGPTLFGNWTSSRVVNFSANTVFDTNGFDATLFGVVTGTPVILSKFGNGRLSLSNLGATSFNPTVFNIDGGEVVLTGNTKLPQLSASITLFSGTFRLDNLTIPVSNRIGVQQNIRVGNGGTGTFAIDAGPNTITQNVNQLALGIGGTGTLRVALSATGAGSVRLNVTGATGYGVIGNNSPSFILQADGLVNTFAAATPGATSLSLTTAPTESNGMLSGSGAANTTTVGILRGGIGLRTSPTPALGFLTQTNTTVGIRLLDESTEYAVNTQTANANTLITAAAPTFATGNINSLYLRGSNTLSITLGNTLTIRSGTILAAGGANTINGTGVSGGGATLLSTALTQQSGFPIYVDAGATLTTNVIFNGSAAGARIVKMGPGRLVFDPRDATGAAISGGAGTLSDVRLFEGTLAIPAGQSLNNLPTGLLVIAGGAGSILEYRGIDIQSTKQLNLNGAGGTLDLTGTTVQLTNAVALTRFTVGNGGELRLTGGTLILGNGVDGSPAFTQSNLFEGGFHLNGGTLALNADSLSGGSGQSSPLGFGTLRLNGGQLAPRYGTRDVVNPVEANANTTFKNNVNATFGVTPFNDTSNAGLRFLAPVRLEGNRTFTNDMTSGTVTFRGSIYDNPFKPAASLTLTATSLASPFVLAGAASHRGGTTITANTSVVIANTLGSATGTGPLTAQAGSEIGGTGFIVPANAGTATFNGTLHPGTDVTTPGVLTIGAPDRTVSVTHTGAASSYIFDLASTLPGSPTNISAGESADVVGPATGNNRLRVLSLNAGSSLTFTPATFRLVSVPGLANWDETLNYSWPVATLAAGTITLTTPILDLTSFNNPANGTFSLSASGNTIYLNFVSAVPEPAMIGAIAVVTLLIGRRSITRS